MRIEFILFTVPRTPSTTSTAARTLAVLGALPLAGCDPIFDVGGAFFPAWIICLIAGGIITLIIREILNWIDIEDGLFWRPVSYLACFFAVSAWTWLYFFST